MIRWLAPGALLALVPKCGLCVLGYLGLGALLGLGGPELCGVRNEVATPLAAWLLGAAAAAIAIVLLARNRSKLQVRTLQVLARVGARKGERLS